MRKQIFDDLFVVCEKFEYFSKAFENSGKYSKLRLSF